MEMFSLMYTRFLPVNLFGENLGYFERYFTNFLSIVEEGF